MKIKIILAIITVLIIVVGFNFLFGCKVKTVCQLTPFGQDFDCDIIYSRLGKYHNEEEFRYRSLANINATACSDEVLDILGKQFNISLKKGGCYYMCCVTDGTCEFGMKEAINIQAYRFEEKIL